MIQLIDITIHFTLVHIIDVIMLVILLAVTITVLILFAGPDDLDAVRRHDWIAIFFA